MRRVRDLVNYHVSHSPLCRIFFSPVRLTRDEAMIRSSSSDLNLSKGGVRQEVVGSHLIVYLIGPAPLSDSIGSLETKFISVALHAMMM